MMELWKCLTVVVVVVVGCTSLANATTQPVIGRCCGGGCESPSGNFSPPLKPEETDVSWVTQDLDCNLTQTVVYYDLDMTNHLALIGDELVLRFVPFNLFPKTRRDYCVEAHGEGYRGAVCQPDPKEICRDAVVCIPKCCGDGEVLENFACMRGSGNLSLPFYSFHGKPIAAPPSVMVGDMAPYCGSGDDAYPTPLDGTPSEVHFLPNGELMDRETQDVREFNQYCVEYNHNERKPLFLACEDGKSKLMAIKYFLQKIGYVTSVVFLTVLLVFHAFIKNLQDTQGKCLISYMVLMAVANIFLFILSEATSGISSSFCVFSGFLLLFSFLAMFFWLNIMCYDVWRVIKSTTRVIPLRGILSQDTKQFRLYCLYGWGTPLVVVAVAAVMHNLPEEHANNIIRPGFGMEKCFLRAGMAQVVYCYGFVTALFILDLAFLGHAMFTLHQAGGASSCCMRPNFLTAFNRNHLDEFWQRFALFVVMVLLWTTEVLGVKIPNDTKEIWIVSDFANSLQGLWVFLVFMVNRKRRQLVINLLKRIPLPCLKKELRTATPSQRSQQTIRYRISPSPPLPTPCTTKSTRVSPEKQSSNATDS